MDSPQLTKALTRSRQLLEKSQLISEAFEVTTEPELRIDYNVAQTIARVSREKNANLIVLGMECRSKSKLSRRLFNNIQDEVMRTAHCPVVVARLLESPTGIKSVLIPIENPSVMTLRVLRFAQVLATANQAEITLLHVHSPRASKLHQTRVQKQLEILLDRLPTVNRSMKIELLAKENVVAAIAKISSSYDLVILRSQRHRVGNAITVGENTTPLLQRLKGSVILVGEPHPQPVRQPAHRQEAVSQEAVSQEAVS